MALSLEDIYDDHVWQVYAFFAYRLNSQADAEDLTQSTFERAAKALSRYDAARASHRTWLLAIAQNLLIDHYRRTSRDRHHQPLADEDLERLDFATPDHADSGLGLGPEIANALAALNDREREIVALRYGADLTGPEIAELKGLTLANVQQILSRSLRRMRAIVEEERALSGE